MSTEDERILIHRLASGELDALESERARALIARDPELGELLEQIEDLQARVHAAFPEPPPIAGRQSFVRLMSRLAASTTERTEHVRSAALPRPVGSRGSDIEGPSAPRFAHFRSAGRGLLESPPGPGAHLFHLRELRRDEGLPVELEFYAGDALALHSEVLLVSAFAGSYHPTPGTLLGSIAERFGIAFGSEPPPGAVRYPGGLLHFAGVACEAFDSLWVVEMTDFGRQFSLGDLRGALENVGGHLTEMLAEGTSITLPLLGTGAQQIDPRDVARELLSALPKWARNPRLRAIRIVTRELEHVAILNRALDDRDFGGLDSALLAACRELQQQIERGRASERVRAALKQLLQIATSADPSMPSIALEGRRVAEAALAELSRGRGGQVRRFDLDRGSSADLVTPQLELLLAYGRSAASGEPIRSNDAVMILYAAMRVADLARESGAGR